MTEVQTVSPIVIIHFVKKIIHFVNKKKPTCLHFIKDDSIFLRHTLPKNRIAV